MKCSYILTILIFLFLSYSLPAQEKPSLSIGAKGIIPPPTRAVLFDQMDNPGTNSITSQNFEAANDIYDSFAADDFAFMDDTWWISSIDVAGVYYNGSGPATSVNVWIYSSNGFGGLPQDILYSALNIIPSAGLADGSFTIDLPDSLVLTEGWYWLCVQANMDLSSGQWGWTGRTIQSFSESVWMNPGGGFATPCTPSWGYRVTDCGVGTDPDNCFRINGELIPVELISFTAAVNGRDVILNWSTATETNNKGFEVEKSQSAKVKSHKWGEIGFVQGNGTSSEVHNYNFTDKNLEPGIYLYRLKQLDFNGSYEYSNVIDIEVNVPLKFSLSQNYPNPFNPTTSIQYTVGGLPEGKTGNQFVSLKVYDILGNEVSTLVNDYKPAGYYTVEFSIDNERLSSGVYFYKLTAGIYTAVKKMILMK